MQSRQNHSYCGESAILNPIEIDGFGLRPGSKPLEFEGIKKTLLPSVITKAQASVVNTSEAIKRLT